MYYEVAEEEDEPPPNASFYQLVPPKYFIRKSAAQDYQPAEGIETILLKHLLRDKVGIGTSPLKMDLEGGDEASKIFRKFLLGIQNIN